MTKRKRKKKDPAAVTLGARGGKKRAKNLTKEERSASARHAINTRWERVRATRGTS